jgi:hypothetical protein
MTTRRSPPLGALALLALALAAAPSRAQVLPGSPQALDREQNSLQLQQEQRQLNSAGPLPGAAAEQQRLNQLQIQNQQAPLPNGITPTLQNNEMQLQLRDEQNRINQLQPSSPAR